jgi:hypothetical protein
MKAAEINARRLAEWARAARSCFPEPVTLHVLAQGYELRCADLKPLQLDPEQA